MNNEFIVSIRNAIRTADGELKASKTGVDMLVEEKFGHLTISKDELAEIKELLKDAE